MISTEWADKINKLRRESEQHGNTMVTTYEQNEHMIRTEREDNKHKLGR